MCSGFRQSLPERRACLNLLDQLLAKDILKLCALFHPFPPERGVRMGVEFLRTMRRSTPTLALPLPGGGNKLVLVVY